MTEAVSNILGQINAPGNRIANSGQQTLDQGDFLRLLTAQLQQQDPLEPVDNKDMLAQMAQFSGLAGTTETNARLADMSAQLDQLIAAQQEAAASVHASVTTPEG